MDSNSKHPSICLLTETFYPLTGGGETQARVLALGLARRGFEVTLLTRRTDSQLPRVTTSDDVVIRRLGPTGTAHLNKWGLLLTAPVELFRRRRDFDVLLVCGYRVLGIPAMIVSLLTGKPCILKADSLGEHSGAFFDPGLRRFRLSHDSWPIRLIIRIRNRLFSRAAAFVAISSAVEDELRTVGVPEQQIIGIPNSVDTDAFQPAGPEDRVLVREKLEVQSHRPVAVFTGRLVTTKGLPMLLRAWQRVVDSVPDALLILVGSGGLGLQNCETELRGFVDRHDLGDNVRFTGSVEDVRDYLRAADVFVFPSRRESFGISVAEAMACGLPVIASQIPGVGDVVVPEVTSRVFPAHNQDALTKAILSLLKDRALRQKMGVAGRQRAESRFSENQVIDRYASLISDLVEGHEATWK